MQEIDIAIIGAGPAGLSAACEAAKAGASVLVMDENYKPGGQLFKQIHKFFGSKEHKAGTRGIRLGESLLQLAAKAGAVIQLNTAVYGIYPDMQICGIKDGMQSFEIKAKKIILATGATENALAFPGCTLPGVMGAGAVQTMINLHRVLPAKDILMIGSGNVGLIVSYQILQAGGNVAALVEAGPKIGGYGVHAAKIRRGGVPILTRHTVKKAYGNNQVEGAVIVALDENFQEISGTEQEINVGCIAIAVGLTPLVELARLSGCRLSFLPRMGGFLPIHDKNMETSVPGIYIAGDISGVEEASTAMEEGRLAGISAAQSLGFMKEKEAAELKNMVWQRMNALRTGTFGKGRFDAKELIISEGADFRVS